MRAVNGSLDLLMVTVNVPLDWAALVDTLAPGGQLVFLGVVTQPVPVDVGSLVPAQKGVAGSPTGAPRTMRDMLDFARRHDILPTVEYFPMSRVNDALAHLRAGKARYRIVLQAEG